MEVLQDIDLELAWFLLERVENKQYTWTYSEVAGALSQRLGRTVNAHFHLSRPLGTVLLLCFDLELPLISAIVRHKPADHRARVSRARLRGKAPVQNDGFFPAVAEGACPGPGLQRLVPPAELSDAGFRQLTNSKKLPAFSKTPEVFA